MKQSRLPQVIRCGEGAQRGRAGRLGRLGKLGGVLCLMLGAGSVTGCDDSKNQSAAPAATPVDLSPIPAPASLLADLFVPKPEAVWKELRGLAGPGAALLPTSYPVLISTLTGLPAAASSSIDSGVPLVGAVVEADEQNFAVVLGVHLRSGRELIAAVTTGADARFNSKLDEASGITELSPKNAGEAEPLGLGVLGNYLLIATKRQALFSAGPYVVRSLPKQTMPAEPIVLQAKHEVLAGPVAKRLRQAWNERRAELQQLDLKNRKDRGGRAPDFGDPAAALLGIEGAVDAVEAILKDSEQARLVVRPGAKHLESELLVVPKPEGEAKALVAGLAIGELTPLTQLPVNTVLAGLAHSHAESRRSQAGDIQKALENLLDQRLSAADGEKVKGALESLAAGRGDRLMFGLARTSTVQQSEIAIFFRSDTNDAAELTKGIRGASGLLGLKAFSEPLEEFVGQIKIQGGKGRVPGLTNAPERIAFEISPKKPPPGAASSGLLKNPSETKRFELLWRIEKGQLDAVMAEDAGPLLLELLGIPNPAVTAGNKPGAQVAAPAGPLKSLSSNEELMEQLSRAKLEASFALVAQPSRLTPLADRVPGGGSPILVVLGRRDGNAVARFDIGQAALQSFARMFLR